MARTSTKEEAESLLRELPSVVGAFVREDINGHPREVHLLIGPGPNPRLLARDVRELLEERLGVPIDQRVISIAQLATSPDDIGKDPAELAASASAHPALPARPNLEPRLRFDTIEAQTRVGAVTIKVGLALEGRTVTGESREVDVGTGRLRAAANASLNAAMTACDQRMRFQLDSISPMRAFGREYVLISVLASSPKIGRRPVPLVAAQPLEDDADHAAAMAALMAINRIIGIALKR